MSKDAHKRKLVHVLCVLGLAVAIAPPAASAATITVTTTADEFTNPGPETGCSLREAIQSSNTDSTFGGCAAGVDGVDDQILLTSGMAYGLTIPDTGDDNTNASGDLDPGATESVTITTTGAAQATIDANGDGVGDPATTGDRVIHNIAPSLTLTNLTLTDGQGLDGGAIKHEPAPGVLTINGSTISGNKATSVAGAMKISSGVVAINDGEIQGNTAPGAGAIWNELGGLTITGSTISDNHAQDATNGSVGALLTSPFGLTTLINSTVSGNTATRSGGGIFSQGTLTLANTTVAANTADVDGGANTGDGGGIFISGGTATLRNSIIADNLDLSGIPPHNDCSGTIVSQLHNLFGSATGCTGVDMTGDDLQGVAGVTAALADNGGPTQTRALLAGSAALNPVWDGAPPGQPCEATDQRGQPRGGAAGVCDIGAFENQPPSLDPIGNKSVQAGQNLTFVISATHPDPADTLTFSASNLPAGATFTPGTQTFSWTPSTPQVGTFPNVGFSVADGTFNDNETISVTVTAVPAPPPAGGTTTPANPTSQATGQRAAALKKCKKKKKSARARRNCKKRANKLPV